MQEDNVQLNSSKAWLLAARPKTLSGAAVPVVIALALAWADASAARPFQWIPAVLCLLFAFIMQIDANFVNDYFDFMKGTDDETRLGPRRACASVWVTASAMRRAMALTTILGCCLGLPLVFYGGWEMLLVGALCVLFCFLYTTHLSYMGLGDLLVLVFFGIVPVCVTYYIQQHSLTWEVFIASLACGFVIDTLLLINNYRDRDNDRRSGKLTLVVRIGSRDGELAYLSAGIVAVVLGLVFLVYGHPYAALLPLVYLLLHIQTYRKMKKINHGRELNVILGQTARNMFIYGILLSIGFLLG
jgi:1,4-dihydroxy-2-naphthoate octaprenyltransferase